MSILNYLKSMSKQERSEFAFRCETSFGHLMNCAYGYKSFAPGLAMRIERETNGSFKVEQLCPEEPWHVVRGKRKAA